LERKRKKHKELEEKTDSTDDVSNADEEESDDDGASDIEAKKKIFVLIVNQMNLSQLKEQLHVQLVDLLKKIPLFLKTLNGVIIQKKRVK
jgi:Ca2+/H+ antiporter